jgi:hypothetical protein
MTDYDKGPSHARDWLKSCVGSMFADATKSFVVADSATGKIIANVTIAEDQGLSPSLLVPGKHNDVFVGTLKQLSRIYVQ